MPLIPENFLHCIEETSDPIKILKANGRFFAVQNQKRKPIKIVVVDGCVIKLGKRCDFLVLSDEHEIFVELKGNDVLYGFEQLASSIVALSLNPSKQPKYAFVIASRVFPSIRTTIQNAQKKFQKNFSCILLVKNNRYDISL